MNIAGYLKTSLLDWPGKISSVIFTVGCNFRCLFCHNRDLVVGKDLQLMGEDIVLDDLKKRKKWIDGLVITGGEPTLQKDLRAFCKKVKDLGIGVKLDTNGTNPEVIEGLIKRKLVDFVAMDIKDSFRKYAETVKVKIDTKDIKQSIEAILTSGLEYEFRTTVVPGIHDRNSMNELAKEMKSYGITRWVWQNFVGRSCLDTGFNGKKGLSLNEVKGWKGEAEKTGTKIILRGWPQ